MKSLKIKSDSLKNTLDIGKHIGANLVGGEIIELVSDLGGGKTSLVKGLAEGARSRQPVSSPSFTICNEYLCSKFKLYHFDFYRLDEPGIIRRELSELTGSSSNVIVIEWPAVIEDSLPSRRLTIEITVTDQTKRLIKLTSSDDLDYLTNGLA